MTWQFANSLQNLFAGVVEATSFAMKGILLRCVHLAVSQLLRATLYVLILSLGSFVCNVELYCCAPTIP
uniref:Secreted protein n=1 Tax=Ascaris lumbricoides TaxID=6252 RepID=A0A0M3HXP7_ASCLU